jgi:hypothetical protein
MKKTFISVWMWGVLFLGLGFFVYGVFFQEKFINPLMFGGLAVLISGVVFLIAKVEEN